MVTVIAELLDSHALGDVIAGILLLGLAAAFVGCGLGLTFTDVTRHRLPNRIVYPWAVGAMAALVTAGILAGAPEALLRALTGGGAWAGGLLLARWIRPPPFGMGDVKLAAVLGLHAGFFGWPVLASAVGLSFVLGGVASLVLVLTRRARLRDRVPFGPSLLLGTATALLLS